MSDADFIDLSGHHLTPAERVELQRCRWCDGRGDRREDKVSRLCSLGCCVQIYCAHCDWNAQYGWGPVGCRHKTHSVNRRRRLRLASQRRLLARRAARRARRQSTSRTPTNP